jgi:hypothetical protein
MLIVPEVGAHKPPEASVDAHLSLAQTRPRHQVQLPKRYQDDPPQASPALPPPPNSGGFIPGEESCEGSNSAPGSLPLSRNRVEGESGNCPVLRTPCNIFGLLRCYYSTEFPSHDPEEFNDFVALSDICNPHHEGNFGPYPNHSSFALGEWYWGGGAQKSKQSFKNLINIITGPGFKPKDVGDTKWDSINYELGGDEGAVWEDEDLGGWKRTAVTIQVPFHRFTALPGVQEYTVHDFHHHSIVSILKEKLSDGHEFWHFHIEPYKLRWQPGHVAPPDSEGSSIRVHGELYTSLAFLKAHKEIQELQGEPGCNLPRVVVGLMFASDQTHLTSFGETKLWPLYLFFGNDSKYRRGKPSLHLCNHVAYFHKVRTITTQRLMVILTLFQLPDKFKDFVTARTGGEALSPAFIAYCNRELFHAQWELILDDEFVEAYTHGVVIICADGLTRRFYLQIFTYSADYPEK